ncbi:MAG: YihY/virulence factor BrkB family protein [Bdellovibrio sp.]
MKTARVRAFITVLTDRFADCHTMTWAASVAFYTCFSLAPLIMISLAFVSQIGLEVQQIFMEEVGALVGPVAAEAIGAVIQNAKDRVDLVSVAGIVGTGTLILSAGLIFGEMREALTEILGDSPTPSEDLSFVHATLKYLKSRLLQIGLAFGFVFAMLVSLLVSTALSTVIRLGLTSLGLGAFFLNFILSFAIYVILFTGIFHFLPVPRFPLKDSFLAGGITSLFFVIGKELVGMYLSSSTLSSSYGAAGSVVVLLAWVYYSTLIVFIGGHWIYAWKKALAD